MLIYLYVQYPNRIYGVGAEMLNLNLRFKTKINDTLFFANLFTGDIKEIK